MNLKITDLTKNYNGQEALSHVSFEVREISVLALIGPSGGGKSTLLKILAGLIKPQAGEVELNESKLIFEENWLHDYRKTIGVVFQAFNLFPNLSAFKNIAMPLEVVHKMSRPEAGNKANELLEKFGLKEHSQKKPYELSGGQQQRIAIARSIAMEPQCLLLDEPTSALDPSLTLEVLNMVAALKEKGTNIIMVTHEIAFAHKVADYVVYINNGAAVEHGYANDLLENPKTAELKDYLKNVL